MADSSIQIYYFFQRSVYKQKFFSVTKLPGVNSALHLFNKMFSQLIGEMAMSQTLCMLNKLKAITSSHLSFKSCK